MTHAPRCVCDACWPTRLREMRALIEAAARRLGERMLRRARSVSLPDGLDWLASGRWNDEPHRDVKPANVIHRDVKPAKVPAVSPRRRAREDIARTHTAQVVDPPPPSQPAVDHAARRRAIAAAARSSRSPRPPAIEPPSCAPSPTETEPSGEQPPPPTPTDLASLTGSRWEMQRAADLDDD